MATPSPLAAPDSSLYNIPPRPDVDRPPSGADTLPAHIAPHYPGLSHILLAYGSRMSAKLPSGIRFAHIYFPRARKLAPKRKICSGTPCQDAILRKLRNATGHSIPTHLSHPAMNRTTSSCLRRRTVHCLRQSTLRSTPRAPGRHRAVAALRHGCLRVARRVPLRLQSLRACHSSCFAARHEQRQALRSNGVRFAHLNAPAGRSYSAGSAH